jgi:hypothetical protein
MVREPRSVGPGSDMASKREFFASLFKDNGELKKFMQHRLRRIRQKTFKIKIQCKQEADSAGCKMDLT